MSACKEIQARLAKKGATLGNHDAALQDHVNRCPKCLAFVEAMAQVDEAIKDLPLYDASDERVATTMAAIKGEGKVVVSTRPPGSTERRWATALAASFVIVASFGVLKPLYPMVSSWSTTLTQGSWSHPSRGKVAQREDRLGLRSTAKPETVELAENEEGMRSPAMASEPLDPLLEPAREALGRSGKGEFFRKESVDTEADVFENEEDVGFARRDNRSVGGTFSERIEAKKEREKATEDKDEDGALLKGSSAAETELALDDVNAPAPSLGAIVPSKQDRADNKTAHSASSAGIAMPSAPSPLSVPEVAEIRNLGGELRQGANQFEGRMRRKQITLTEPIQDTKSNTGRVRQEKPFDDLALLSQMDQPQPKPASPGWSDKLSFPSEPSRLSTHPQTALQRARRFLAGLQSLEHLSFQTPTGYWANTYIPGDPTIRTTARRLRQWKQSNLGSRATGFALERAAQQNQQPFDPPQNSALALYLQSDISAVQGPTRMRLQVGLQSRERRGGHRPTMNVAVVLDLTGADTDSIESRAHALMMALERARQPGDRFSLTVTGGVPGAAMIPPEQFRYGPLRVALEKLFQKSPPVHDAEPLSVVQAIRLAADNVQKNDAPRGAILGSSLILLVTASPFGGEISVLEQLAHENSVAGILMSVVSLGGTVNLDQVDRLVLAGQGNRRVLHTVEDAAGVVDKELHTASRAVARALRLKIRLAPGVKLIDILGSHRLDERRARRVREAERSIDLRAAKILGIQADRGEDEEGIQIVIPSFYAGDTHVILLDVIAEKAGAIAEVTLRYKDLVSFRNGVARAQLSLDAANPVRGPLERNVLKNVFAMNVSAAVRRASVRLAAGDQDQARAILTAVRVLSTGLRSEISAWSSDAELLADEAMLSAYMTLLESPRLNEDVQQRLHIVDSLRLAAWRKVLHVGVE